MDNEDVNLDWEGLKCDILQSISSLILDPFLCPPMASCGGFSAFTTTQKTLRSKEKLTNGRFLTTQRSGKRREEFLSKIFTSRGVAEVLFALERAHLRLLFFCKIAAILQKILSVKIFFLACESTLVNKSPL